MPDSAIATRDKALLSALLKAFLNRCVLRRSGARLGSSPVLDSSTLSRSLCALGVAALAFAAALGGDVARAEPQAAIAMHGSPAFPYGVERFRYADPQASRGGEFIQGVLGAFDSLNPFIVRGLAPPQIRGYVVESLMARGYDEPFTLYGLLASSVDTDAARSYVAFEIDPRARFSDGAPVTPQDVVFSWTLLRDKGRPNFRTYYSKVAKAEIVGRHGVRFDLAGSDDRELPLILGLMPILPRHATDPATFEDTSLKAPIGSGPYRVAEVDAGRSLTLSRNPDYWGRDLAVSRGFWNFDTVRFDFYRDGNSLFEAFKKGLYDIRVETDPSRWETGYDFPAVQDGRVVKDVIPSGLSPGMSGFVFNMRRPLFADVRVREALTMMLDAEWINTNFFFGRYGRTGSYFEGSELSALGRPADARERTLLAPFPAAVRADMLDGAWSPPSSDGSGRDRDALRRALAMLGEAGWALSGGVLKSKASGEAFNFELLVTTKEHERLALTYAGQLARAGIVARVRVADAVQFDQRRLAFEYDMIPNRWDQSLSPGNEQAFYWGSAAANQAGSRNYMGVRSPAVDAMIAAMLAATSREDFVSAVRALDRTLMSGFYVVPLFHAPAQWVARWGYIKRPAENSLYGYLPETWWRDATR